MSIYIRTIDLLLENWNIKKINNKLYIQKLTVGRGNNAKPFLLPESIELNKEVAECIGLYLGDGKLTDNDLMHAHFSSKDVDLVKKMLKFFKFLGVKNSDITFTLTYNSIGLNEAKRNFETMSKKFRIQKSQRHRFPTYSIQVNGKIFRIFLKSLIMKSLNYINSDSELRRGFLRGYFAAEGWIGYSNTENYIANIGFAYNPKTEQWLKDFCIECLSLEGINSKIKVRDSGHIVITNWKNYYKLWKLGVFEGCERKRKKFAQYLLNVKICCDLKENTRLRLFSGDQYEIAKQLGTYQATISNMKTGSKRNMWPTVTQIKELSKINKVSLYEIKQNILQVRFGSLTILEANDELLNDVFNLR